MSEKRLFRTAAFGLLSGLLILSPAYGWQRVTNGLPSNPTITRIASNNDGNLSVLNVSSGSPTGIYVSTNGGYDWSKAASLPGNSQSTNSLLVIGNTIFVGRHGQSVGTNAILYSTNLGATWVGATGIPNTTNIHMLATDGSALFAGAVNSGVVWRSMDNGQSWSQISSASGSFNNGTLRSLGGKGGRAVAATSQGLYALEGSGTNWLQTTNLANALTGSRMASQDGGLFVLYNELNRRVISLADGTTNWVNATNGLLEGYFNNGSYRDIAAGAGSLFLTAQFFTPSFTFESRLFMSTNVGSNWASHIAPSTVGTDIPSMAVISNSVFLSGPGGTAPGLYRITITSGSLVFAPAITLQPKTVGVHIGSTAVFTVAATGDGLSYQWRKNDVDLSGQTTATLTISNAQLTDATNYNVVISNAGGTVTSDNAKLIVIPRTPGSLQLDYNPGYFATDLGNTGGPLYGTFVNAVYALSNGQVLVGGQFSHAGTIQIGDNSYTNGFYTPGVARLNADGSVDTSFQANTGTNFSGSISAIVQQPDGKILISGDFNRFNGAAVTNIARLNSNGTLDSSFVTNQFNSAVFRLRLQSDGKIIVQGIFTTVNGVARPGIARLNSDGSFDATWPVGTQPGGSISDAAVFSNDEVLLSGGFGTFGGTASRKFLGLLDTTGAVDTGFNHGFHTTVHEVNVQPGGLIWCYGSSTRFTNSYSPLSVTTIPSLVRLWPDGSLASLSPTNVSNGSTLYSQQDGKMIMASYNSATGYYGLLRFNADGSVDNTFDTGLGFDNQVRSMSMSPSGDLYVAGFFTSAYGVPVSRFVRLYGATTNVASQMPIFTVQPSASLAVAVTSNGVVRAAATGAAPLSYYWFKNGALFSTTPDASLALNNFAAGDAGDYQLVVSNNFGAVTSSIAAVSLAQAPSITQNPPATSGSVNGGTVTVPVGVSGTAPLFYQWYVNNSPNLTYTNNPLVIVGFQSGHAGNYYLVVSNQYGKATSSVCNLVIGNAPNILLNPASQTLNGTGDVSIFSTASGSTPMTYFWFQNSNLVFTTSATNRFTMTNAVPTNAGIYRVVISNAFGISTSSPATITIVNPYLQQGPQGRTVVIGGTTNFTATILGTAPLEYYWYRRSFGAGAVTNLISTGNPLTLNNVTRADGQYFYFVIGSNQWGSVTSSIASLTVQFPPNITNITSTNLVAEINENVYAAVEYEASPNPNFFWYQNGVYQPSLFNSGLQFYPAVATNAGTYYLIVSNYLGTATSAPIVLTVKPARGPTITNIPTSVVTAVGQSFQVNPGVDGTPTLQYRWFREGAPVTSWSTSPQLHILSAITNHAGGYQVVVTNNYGSATSSVVNVTVIVPQPASFAGKQLVKIADSTTAVPGLGTNKFNGFRDAFILNREVWFGGSMHGVPFSAGVYHWSNNVLAGLVNTNHDIPGGTGKFTNFYGSTYLSDGKVVFAARGGNEQNGIYAWTNGSIIKLYDKNTVMPGRGHTFENFGWPTVVGNQFAFLGIQSFGNTNFQDDYRGVYVSSNNVLTKLADTNDILPGVGYWRASSSQVAFSGTKVAWWGIGETSSGIYTVGRTSPISLVANESTINPATGVNFDGFTSPPDSYGDRTYFVGHDAPFDTSLYYHDAGGIHLIAKPGDSVPGRGIVFQDVGYPGYSANQYGVYFSGLGSSYSGVFYWNGTNTVKVIDSFDTLEGQNISYAYIADVDHESVLFYVGFTNGKQALYAFMPAPGGAFGDWASTYNLPAGQSDPEDDPDGDGVSNVFEYYFGNDPSSPSSSNEPTGTSVSVGGQTYAAITFIRKKDVAGVTLQPQASSTLDFSNSLGTVVESALDLGDGTELVTIRSAVNSTTQATQFLRIRLSIP